MHNTTQKFRIVSLLLALGLLLGLGVVGCSDQDREKSDTHSGDAVTIHYTFFQETSEKVSYESTKVRVYTGYYDANENLVEVPHTPRTQDITSLPVAADGSKSFDIVTTKDTTTLQVVFMHKEEEMEGYYKVDSAYTYDDIVFVDGEASIISTEEDLFRPTIELYNGEVQTNQFAVGDTITVKAYVGDVDVTEKTLPFLFSANEDVVERSEGEPITFTAVGNGTSSLFYHNDKGFASLGDQAIINVGDSDKEDY